MDNNYELIQLTRPIFVRDSSEDTFLPNNSKVGQVIVYDPKYLEEMGHSPSTCTTWIKCLNSKWFPLEVTNYDPKLKQVEVLKAIHTNNCEGMYLEIRFPVSGVDSWRVREDMDPVKRNSIKSDDELLKIYRELKYYGQF